MNFDVPLAANEEEKEVMDFQVLVRGSGSRAQFKVERLEVWAPGLNLRSNGSRFGLQDALIKCKAVFD